MNNEHVTHAEYLRVDSYYWVFGTNFKLTIILQRKIYPAINNH